MSGSDVDELIDTSLRPQLCGLSLSCALTADDRTDVAKGQPIVMFEFRTSADAGDSEVPPYTMCVTPQHARRIAADLVKLAMESERLAKKTKRH